MKERTPYLAASVVAGIILILVLLFYVFFLNHVAINQVGIAYDSINGQVSVQASPGWYVTRPTTKVVKMNTLPIRVTLPSFANVVNTKLVRFKPEGALDFIKVQGFSYSDSTYQDSILMGYAFSGNDYPFLEIIQHSTDPTVK